MAIGKTFVIDKNTVESAKKEQYAITIKNLFHPEIAFTGYMTNEFKIRTDAKYAPVFNTEAIFPSSQQAASTLLGKGLFNTGFWSQRYFQNGGYIILEPELRIVDFSGDGVEDSPIYATQFFTSLCLPAGGPGLIDLVNSTSNLAKSIEAEAKSLKENPLKTIRENFSRTGDFFSNLKLNNIVSENPAPVSVKIGKFFDSDVMMGKGNTPMGFYVQAADCTFSKEMTSRGPLYVNIKLELQSMARPANSGITDSQVPRFSQTFSNRTGDVIS